jgi:hypothetical protein
MSIQRHDMPCADHGLISYRYARPWGWIMIGAKDDTYALNEAFRSISPEKPTTDKLQKWDGQKYITV